MTNRLLRVLALAGLVLGLSPAGVLAQAAAQGPRAPMSALQPGHLVHAELLPGWETPQGTRMAALHLQLAPGWKTYWRIPGEAGIAPRFDWSESQNLGGVRIHWPRPEVFDQGGYRSIGYHGELVLPIELTPRRPGRPILLAGAISIGVCDEICVPVDLSVSAAMRGAGGRDPRIAGALATVARPAQEGGLRGALRCGVQPSARGLDVTLRATLPPLGGEELMLLELPGTPLWVGESRTWREGGELVAHARVRAPRGQAATLDRGRVAVTFLGGSGLLEHEGCTAAE